MKNFKIIFFLFTAILIGCNGEKESHKITIATLKGPSAMGMIQMIDSLNQLENSEIEITVYNEPIQVRKLMLEEKVDFAILPTTMGAILYNKGIPYQLAAIPVWGTLYLFGQDTTIKSWDDLKGKRINLMAKGMTPDVLFRQLLIKNGIDPDKDVVLDYSFPTHIDLANAVAANQVALGVISEPLVSMVMEKNKKVFPILDLNKEWSKVYQNVAIAQTALLVNSGFAKNNPQEVKNILTYYQKSSDWVNKNPKDAAKLIVQYNILPTKNVAYNAIPRSNLDFTEAYLVKNQIHEYLKVFFEMNPDIVGGKLPDDDFYLN